MWKHETVVFGGGRIIIISFFTRIKNLVKSFFFPTLKYPRPHGGKPTTRPYDLHPRLLVKSLSLLITPTVKNLHGRIFFNFHNG